MRLYRDAHYFEYAHRLPLRVVPEYLVDIVRVVYYAVNTIFVRLCVCELELIFPTVTHKNRFKA